MLKPSKVNIERIMAEIHNDLTTLAVEEDFRQTVLNDIQLAGEYFKEKNTLSVFNCLTVMINKFQSYLLLTQPRCAILRKILMGLHQLQDLLVKLPVCTVGATGATGPAGPPGTSGPTGPMGPIGPGGAQTVVTNYNWCPSARFPHSQNARVKSSFFPCNTEKQSIFGNAKRK